MNKTRVNAIIAANPKACWRTIKPILDAAFGGTAPDWALSELDKARPNCGYDCDGDDGKGGCPVSGRCEP